MPTIPFSKRFRQRHPRLTRGLVLTMSFGFAFAVGFAYASWAMVCRAGRCPSANALDGYEPRQTSKIYAADGRFELFKTTKKYDGAVGREQHHYPTAQKLPA